MDDDILAENDSPPLTIPKPRLRGRLHQIFLFLFIPAGILLVSASRTAPVRIATIVYVISLLAVLGTSAAYHRGNWSPPALRRMRRLDHSMIFVLIAGTATAYAVLVLDGFMRWLFLITMWAGAIVGITLKLVKIDGFARLGGTLYIVLGWIGILTLPQALRSSHGVPLILVGAGGIMYTVGAVVFLRKRPDPFPLTFGYHEIWHTFVVAACVCHFIAISMLVSSTT